MSRLAASIVLASAAAGALALLVSAMRTARRHHDVDESTVLVAAMGLLINVPVAVVAFSGSLTQFVDTLGITSDVFPSWYHRVDDLAKILVVLICVVVAVRQLRRPRLPVHSAALLGIALWGVAALASGLHGESVVSLSTGTLLACLIAAAVLPHGRGACVGAAFAGTVLAIASGLLFVVRHDAAVEACSRKCSVIGTLLTGVLPNPNLLGVVLAAAIPFAYLGLRGRARLWLVLYLAGMVFATGTRTAMAAAGITLVVLLLLRPSLEGQRLVWPLGAVPWLVVIGAVLVWLYLVDHHWAATAFTDRGLLWGLAEHYFHQSPWIGYGPLKWADLYQISLIPAGEQRSAHNQLLDLLFATGLVGAALLVSMIAVTIASAGRARTGVVVTLGTIMMIGATEGAWQVGSFDFMSFTLVALILTGEVALGHRPGHAAKRRRPERSRPGPMDGPPPPAPPTRRRQRQPALRP